MGRKELSYATAYSPTSWEVRARAQVAGPSTAALAECCSLACCTCLGLCTRLDRPLLHQLLFKAMQRELSHRPGQWRCFLNCGSLFHNYSSLDQVDKN